MMRYLEQSPRLLKAKVKSLGQLKNIVGSLRKRGNKIVFTNGCFDILHYGHVQYLEDARKKGDVLIVGINNDASVQRLKGKNRPIVKELDRIKTISALESVDYAVLFKEVTPIKVIKALKPDILVKGSDWEIKEIVGGDFVHSYGGKVLTVNLRVGRSTTNLINKISRSRIEQKEY